MSTQLIKEIGDELNNLNWELTGSKEKRDFNEALLQHLIAGKSFFLSCSKRTYTNMPSFYYDGFTLQLSPNAPEEMTYLWQHNIPTGRIIKKIADLILEYRTK